MEDLPLGRIAALVPEFALKDLPLGRTHDDDDDTKQGVEYHRILISKLHDNGFSLAYKKNY